jgi:hypothetical protein
MPEAHFKHHVDVVRQHAALRKCQHPEDYNGSLALRLGQRLVDA